MAQIADLHPSIPSDIMTLANTFLEDNRCFRALSPESIKEAHLHPRVTNETTIQEYYDRTLTQSYRDRQEFHLYIPFEDRLNKMLDKLDQLLEKVEALDRKTEKSDKKIEEQRSEMEEQRSKMEEQNSKIKKLEETNLEIKTDRFELSLGNMLIELTRILAYKYKPHIATDRDTKRLKKFAATLRDNQLHAENIPQTCWGDIRNLKDFVHGRNHQAHEGADKFAKLLLDEDIGQGELDKWRNVFFKVYGKSVEEMAPKPVSN